MNSTTARILTIAGTKIVEQLVKRTAEKMTQRNGLKEQDNVSDLIIGFKVKGNPNIFFDFTAIRSYIKRPLTESDVAVVIVNVSDPRMHKVKLMRVKEEDIVGTYKFNPTLIEQSIVEKVFNNNNNSQDNTSEVAEKHNEDQQTSQQNDDSDDFNLKEKPYNKIIHFPQEEKETPQEDIIDVEEIKPIVETTKESTTLLGRITEKGVKAVQEVSQNVSEIASVVDQFKGRTSIKIIHETCDTNTSLTAFEGELDGTQKVVKGGNGVMEILHIYKDNNYIGSYQKSDLFAILSPMLGDNKIEITKIKHISTIRGEFFPKDKF